MKVAFNVNSFYVTIIYNKISWMIAIYLIVSKGWLLVWGLDISIDELN